MSSLHSLVTFKCFIYFVIIFVFVSERTTRNKIRFYITTDSNTTKGMLSKINCDQQILNRLVLKLLKMFV